VQEQGKGLRGVCVCVCVCACVERLKKFRICGSGFRFRV
jgi:hypothetical protein